MMTIALDLHALFSHLAITIVGNDEYSYERNGHDFCMTFEQALAVGITSPEEADFHSFLSYCYYDGYKSVHGVKARWVDYCSLSIEELRYMNDCLDAEFEEAA